MVPAGQEYPISDFAKLFPDMDSADYDRLVASIRDRGLLEPISVWRGGIIDGRHRLSACLEASVAPRFAHLDESIDPLEFVLAKNLARRHLDPTQRALIAYQLSRTSRPGGDRRSPDYRRNADHSAILPDALTQKQAADRLRVSPRLVRYAGHVMSSDSPAAPALQQALRDGRVKVSDAARVVGRPAEIQQAALERLNRGKAGNLAAAVRQLTRESEDAADTAALAANRAEPLSETVTLHHADLADLTALVEPASVDIIITHLPHGPETLPWLAALAAFAVHALKSTGTMLVLTDVDRLPDTLAGLKHPDLLWVTEFDYRDDAPGYRSGPPHWTRLRRKPLLIYGKQGFRIPAGDNVIELPRSKGGAQGTPPSQRYKAGMELIAQRFGRPGLVLCNPFMMGQAGSALAARKLGCRFIGADQNRSALARVRRYLHELGE